MEFSEFKFSDILNVASEGVYPNGIRSVFSELIAKEGFLGLYRGMTPVMLRAFPANAVSFDCIIN